MIPRILQDGIERSIESLSLIDAVMPDIVSTRQQQLAQQQELSSSTSTSGQGQQVKMESNDVKMEVEGANNSDG